MATPDNRIINIALLGLGKLGSGFYKILMDKQDKIKEETGFEIRLKKILIRNIHFKRPSFVDTSLLTTEISEIINDKSISIAIDAIGGIEPTFSIIKQLLINKVNIISANRTLLASKMHELADLANKNKVHILPEASLGGGIPIIGTLQRDLVANKIHSVIGILSGTSNFILSEMTRLGISLKEALKISEIQKMSESISVIDYEGSDAAQKVSIIAAAAFGIDFKYLHIHAEGIADVDVSDIRYAKEFGYEFKLLAILRDHQESFEIHVHPTLVPNDHPLVTVRGEYNAFLIQTDLMGNYIIYGKGVGIEAACSLIVRDIVSLAGTIFQESKKESYNLNWNDKPVLDINDIISSYYIRFPCHDKPGVIGLITTKLGEFKINIGSAHAEIDTKSASQLGYVHIFVDNAREKDVLTAIKYISGLNIIRDRIKYFRIL
jgi:homoserine dehydrogenase